MSKRQSGNAAIEFAIIAPLMLALVFGTVDCTRFFGTHQTLLMAVRESADAAYRSCSAFSDSNACLQDALVERLEFLAGELPGADLLVSMYRYDTTSNTIIRSGIYPADKTKSGYISHYSATIIKNSFPGLLNSNNQVVGIAEVFYPHGPGKKLVSILTLKAGVLYESAIF